MCGLDAFYSADVDDHLAHCLVNDELRFFDFVLDADHQIHQRDVKQQIDEKWNPLAAYCKQDEDAAHDEADNQNERDGYFGGINGLHRGGCIKKEGNEPALAHSLLY